MDGTLLMGSTSVYISKDEYDDIRALAARHHKAGKDARFDTVHRDAYEELINASEPHYQGATGGTRSRVEAQGKARREYSREIDRLKKEESARLRAEAPEYDIKRKAEAERSARLAHGEKWSTEKHHEALNRHRAAQQARAAGEYAQTAAPVAEQAAKRGGRGVVRGVARGAAVGGLLGGTAVAGQRLVRRHRAPRGTPNKLASMVPTVPTPAPVVPEIAEAARRLPIKRYAIPAVATAATALGAGALAGQLRKDDMPGYRANQVWYYDRSADAFYEEDIDKGIRSGLVSADYRQVGQAIGRNKGKIAAASVLLPAAVIGGRKAARAMAARGITRESQGLTGAHAADYVANRLERNPIGGRIGRALDRQLDRKPGMKEMQGKDTLVAAGLAGGVGLGGGLYLANRNKRY